MITIKISEYLLCLLNIYQKNKLKKHQLAGYFFFLKNINIITYIFITFLHFPIFSLKIIHQVICFKESLINKHYP